MEYLVEMDEVQIFFWIHQILLQPRQILRIYSIKNTL